MFASSAKRALWKLSLLHRITNSSLVCIYLLGHFAAQLIAVSTWHIFTSLAVVISKVSPANQSSQSGRVQLDEAEPGPHLGAGTTRRLTRYTQY